MASGVCPWYLGYLLASPLRRLLQNPEKILRPYVKKGMKVLEVGPGMGFFSLPLATMVGEMGSVICVDLQEKMLSGLRRRASRAGLDQRIETRLCGEKSLQINDFKEQIDFALAFAVVHEVPDQKFLIAEIFSSLKQDGSLLISEPKGHVTPDSFNNTLITARDVGFTVVDSPDISRSISALLKKQKN